MTTTADSLGGAPISAGQSAGHNIFVLGNIIAGGYYERAERPFGLSLAQWTVLRTVLIMPGLSQADVAGACGLNVMNVSRAVAGLRQKGLVDTADDPRNQRRKMLTATTIGTSIGKDLAERERLLYQHVFAGLEAKDLEHLDAVVREVIARLAESPPPEPPPPSRDWRAALETAAAESAESPSSTSKRKHQISGAKT